MLRRAAGLLRELPQEEVDTGESAVFRLPEDEDAFTIAREDDAWRVRGVKVERVAAMTNWEYDEAVMRTQRILEAMGVSAALEQAGIQAGDTVYIGDIELEWWE